MQHITISLVSMTFFFYPALLLYIKWNWAGFIISSMTFVCVVWCRLARVMKLCTHLWVLQNPRKELDGGEAWRFAAAFALGIVKKSQGLKLNLWSSAVLVESGCIGPALGRI